jgi:hypothetical protein
MAEMLSLCARYIRCKLGVTDGAANLFSPNGI